jgi:UrcA family protein
MDTHDNGSSFTRRAQLTVLAAIGALGATAALTSNAPIVASDSYPRTVKIEYGDLNLSTRKGKEALSQRIRQAVDLVCTEPSPRVLAMWSEYRKCMQNATDSAWSQIHWPERPLMEAARTATPTPSPTPTP